MVPLVSTGLRGPSALYEVHHFQAEVREQSTLDLYVIRTAGALGATLPFDSVRRQSRQLMERRCPWAGAGLVM